MRNSVFILMMLLMSVSLNLFAQPKTKVGVYVVGESLTWEQRAILGDNIVEKFAESDQYTAVNRSEAVNTLLDEVYKVQSNGHVDFSQVKNPTKQLAESQICGVSIIKIDDMLVFRASLVDVSTAEVLKTAKTQYDQSKGKVNYSILLDISNKLCHLLIPEEIKHTNVGMATSNAYLGSRAEMARVKMEELKKYDVSFQEFKYQTRDEEWYQYLKDCPAAKQCMNEMVALNYTGAFLLPLLGGAGATTFGVIYGKKIENSKYPDPNDIIIMTCGIIGSFLPGIIILSCAPSCKRKAWKEYRRPYDDAVDELKQIEGRERKPRALLQVAPAVNFDYAGVQVRLTLP